MIEVYTDGSCLGNPGPGGWAYIINEFIGRGGAKVTTNNTDSNYVKMGLLEWSKNWERNGWKTSKGENVKNKDLWVHMLYLLRKIEFVDIKWVKAHNGNEKNEIVDTQAREYAYLFSKKE